MSAHVLHLQPCPCCGYDVARVMPADEGWRVRCNPDEGGCGAVSVAAPTEGGAIEAWNMTALMPSGRWLWQSGRGAA